MGVDATGATGVLKSYFFDWCNCPTPPVATQLQHRQKRFMQTPDEPDDLSPWTHRLASKRHVRQVKRKVIFWGRQRDKFGSHWGMSCIDQGVSIKVFKVANTSLECMATQNNRQHIYAPNKSVQPEAKTPSSVGIFQFNYKKDSIFNNQIQGGTKKAFGSF